MRDDGKSMKEKPVLQILGGGRLQKKIIRQAEEQGIAVAVVDRNPSAPGMALGSYRFRASINNYRENLHIARTMKVDGILTLGTDQPVLTAAKIAETLHLPFFVSPETALLATNKERMKSTMVGSHIPTAKYVTIGDAEGRDAVRKKLRTLSFPLVVKPVDSQGQRGVALVEDERQLLLCRLEASRHSRKGRLIVEEYVNGPEVTANAWVRRGKVYLLALTDRVTFFSPPRIGVCLAHVFPSRHGRKYLREIKTLLQKIADAFTISEGPVYVQILLSRNGPLIAELACRIGGGHEDDLIPLVSGVDVRQCLIDFALGRPYTFNNYDFTYDSVGRHYGVFFVAARDDDRVSVCAPLEHQVSHKHLLWGDFYVKRGSKVHRLRDATDRIGALLVRGSSRKALWSNARHIYKALSIEGSKYENLVEDIFSLPLKGA